MCDDCDYSDDDESVPGLSVGTALRNVRAGQLLTERDVRDLRPMTRRDLRRALLPPGETMPDVRPAWRRRRPRFGLGAAFALGWLAHTILGALL